MFDDSEYDSAHDYITVTNDLLTSHPDLLYIYPILM